MGWRSRNAIVTAMKKSFKIPKVIRLPGWPVRVKLVDQTDLNKVVDEGSTADAAFNYSDDGGEIWILKTLPITQQRTCLAHELQHAIVDYLDVMLRSNAAKLP